MSHPQERHKKLKQQKDFFKLFDPIIRGRLIAVVNLNYMFPIPKEETSPFVKKNIHTYRTFKTEKEKSKYIDLLDTELKIVNNMDLGTKAQELYKFKYEKIDDIISKRCIDFKAMEKLALEYRKNKAKNETS